MQRLFKFLVIALVQFLSVYSLHLQYFKKVGSQTSSISLLPRSTNCLNKANFSFRIFADNNNDRRITRENEKEFFEADVNL
jgi:hypothetical protein